MSESMSKRTCGVSPCEEQHYARGMCKIHYDRWREHGDARRAPFSKQVGAPATQKITLRDLEWAAGFYEGEGCVSAHPRCAGAITLTLSQVNKEPLDRIHRLFGGPAPTQYPCRPGIFSWQVSGARARGIAMTLYSLLSEKRRKQIRVALCPS